MIMLLAALATCADPTPPEWTMSVQKQPSTRFQTLHGAWLAPHEGQ
jgi:hypothetical protein